MSEKHKKEDEEVQKHPLLQAQAAQKGHVVAYARQDLNKNKIAARIRDAV